MASKVMATGDGRSGIRGAEGSVRGAAGSAAAFVAAEAAFGSCLGCGAG